MSETEVLTEETGDLNLGILEPPKRDNWEKFEIICKGSGALLVPIAIAILGILWNNQASKRQQVSLKETASLQISAQMSTIAVGILQTKANSQRGGTELRTWAVSVLQNPLSPPRLDETAAETLRLSGLSIGPYDITNEDLRRFSEIANRDNELRE